MFTEAYTTWFYEVVTLVNGSVRGICSKQQNLKNK